MRFRVETVGGRGPVASIAWWKNVRDPLETMKLITACCSARMEQSEFAQKKATDHLPLWVVPAIGRNRDVDIPRLNVQLPERFPSQVGVNLIQDDGAELLPVRWHPITS